MRTLFALLMILGVLSTAQAQQQKNRFGAWFLPSAFKSKHIYGLAIGPFSNCLQCEKNERQTTYGIHVEIPGQGLVPPIFYYNSEAWDAYYSIPDSLMEQKINGLAIAPGGLARLGIVVNGINLSGLNTETSKVNGISTALIFCFNQRMNGLSLGGINYAQSTHGVQLGVLNISEKARGLQLGLLNSANNFNGLQIGLWNYNGKRGFPFINFKF